MRSQPAFVLVPPSEDEEDKHFVLMLRMGDEVFSVGPYLSESEARRDCALALQDARRAGVKPLPQVWRVVASGNLDAVWAHNREQALHLMLMMLGRNGAPSRFGLAPEIDPDRHGAVYLRWLPFLERLGRGF